MTQGMSRGVALAFGANVAAGGMQGARGAFGANVTQGDMRGLQLAFGANITRGDFEGMQIAMANITAGDVRGFQVGMFNISRSATGSLGLVNIFRDGYVQPEVYVSDEGLVMAGIRHGSGAFFNTYSLGQRAFRNVSTFFRQ